MARFVQLNSGIVISESAYAEALGTKPSMTEIATEEPGMDITSGGWWAPNLIKPPHDEILRTKGHYTDYKIYDEIARDDQVKTCRNQRELALIAKEWGVDPGDDSRAAKKAAARVTAFLQRLAWDDKTQKMLAAVLYGYAVAEVLWATDGTEITIDDIKVRNRARFGFFPNGELRMRTFYTISAGEALPPGKFWAFSCGADYDDEHYGLGLGHFLYWPTFFKKHGMRSWLQFLDKFAQPTAVGKYPTSASAQEKLKLLQALNAVQNSTAIRIPESMQIELIEASRSGTADYLSLVSLMNAAITKIYLGHTGATDATPGKLGGTDTADEVREDLIKADADLVCGSFNRTVCKWLTYYNDGDSVPPPRVWRKTEPPADLLASANKDKVIFDMGYKPTLKYVSEKYEGEYEAITASPPVDAGSDNAGNGPAPKPIDNPVLFSDPHNPEKKLDAKAPGQPDNAAQVKKDGSDDNGPDPTSATAQADILTKEAGSTIKSLVDTLRVKVEKAESLEALRDDLLTSYGDLDSDKLAKVMEVAFAAADLSGRFDVMGHG